MFSCTTPEKKGAAISQTMIIQGILIVIVLDNKCLVTLHHNQAM
jgi:hypothetical protein